MEYVIKFLADFEVPIYLVLGIVAVVYLRRIMISLEEKRTAIFGLEREAAQRKVTAAASILILVGLLTVMEFVCCRDFMIAHVKGHYTHVLSEQV